MSCGGPQRECDFRVDVLALEATFASEWRAALARLAAVKQVVPDLMDTPMGELSDSSRVRRILARSVSVGCAIFRFPLSQLANSLTSAIKCASMNSGTVKFGAKTIGNWKTIDASGLPW